MKSVSILALVAALALPTMAIAQDVSISAEVSTSAEVSVSAPDVSSAVSSAVSDVSSAVSSASSEVSSAVSDASSELSSAVSSELSSSSAMSGEMDEMNCDTLDTSSMMLVAIDATALASVDSVTVFSIDDCTGIGGLAEIDGSAAATLQAHPAVIEALAAQGETGAEVIAYNLDGTSLTVFVRDNE